VFGTSFVVPQRWGFCPSTSAQYLRHVVHTVTPISKLAEALQLGDRELVSIVGGGGKTTTLFALGDQLPGRVVLTTTTKMGSERDEGVPVLLAPSDSTLAAQLDETSTALVWSDRAGHRAEGVSPEQCDRWFASEFVDHVVIEADGSRRKPFKAPYAYEPVVPADTTMLLACIGAHALGQPIATSCHRADAVVDIVGGSDDDPLTPGAAAAVLLSDVGSRKGLPVDARFAVLIHQVTSADPNLVDALVDRLADQVPVLCIATLATP